jgi:hypothetical protein
MLSATFFQKRAIFSQKPGPCGAGLGSSGRLETGPGVGREGRGRVVGAGGTGGGVSRRSIDPRDSWPHAEQWDDPELLTQVHLMHSSMGSSIVSDSAKTRRARHHTGRRIIAGIHSSDLRQHRVGMALIGPIGSGDRRPAPTAGMRRFMIRLRLPLG